KAADATAVAPAESGIIQKSQSKKLFGVLPVYRADVQQGNFVSKEMVSQLKVGMTPEQVRFVMGTPLLTDIFHGQRWDYPFRMRRGDGQITTSHVSVFFNEGRVERFEGGDLPQEKDYLDQLAIPKK
ncbi:MAG: outer membrane protein assembly factor BamE, partial [bacterium]